MVVIALAAAAVLLIFVFFILPQLVTPGDVGSDLTDPGQAASSGNIVASGSVAKDTGNERNPFAEAQESALRRDAQKVLQSHRKTPWLRYEETYTTMPDMAKLISKTAT